jgi:hypothetical protein
MVLFILIILCLIFSYSVAFGEQIKVFIPDKPWEITMEMKDFTPWDVLQSRTILGGNTANGIIITIVIEKEKSPLTPGEVLKKYWHDGSPGEYITEFASDNMIIVSSKEASLPLGKSFNGYAVKEEYSFDIHINANLFKTTKQDVINIIRSFRISPSSEKQAMEKLISDLKSAKDEQSREQLVLAFTNKYPKNSWAFMIQGETYFGMEQYKEAQKAYLRALENHRTQPLRNPVTLWFCYDGLGLIYGMLKQSEPSKSFFEQGYKCAESMGDEEKQAISTYNLACFYAETNDFPNAMKYLEKAISFNSSNKIRARTDSSFTAMKDRADFKKLVFE